MFIPETIGTVAALLSFVEFMMRLATYLSPQQKRALGEARVKIKSLSPSAPIDQARDILNESIRKHIPEPDVAITQEDISLGLKAIEEYDLGLYSPEASALPLYGCALSFLCDFIGHQFTKWNCYEAWGDQLPSEDSTTHLTYYLLPVPRFAKAIRSIMNIHKAVPKSYASGSWYFYGTKIQGKNEIMGGGDLLFTKRTYYEGFNWRGKTTYSLQHSTLDFSGYEFGIRQHFPSGESWYTLTAEVSQQLASGLLGDFMDYSRRVRGEKLKSESMKSRLSGLLKK